MVAKDVTYVPTNGLLAPMQLQDQPFSNPTSYMVWVSRDPLGIQENKNGYLYAIDPFGSLVANVQPPTGGPPSYIPVFGATYAGITSNSFINANNFSGGCLLDGRPANCNSVRFQLQNNPFVQLDRNHSLPWTESGANQTPQLPSGIREEWRLVQPGKELQRERRQELLIPGNLFRTHIIVFLAVKISFQTRRIHLSRKTRIAMRLPMK